MKQVTNFEIGKKVRWYFENLVDKEVVIASEIVGSRVRINRIGKTGIVHGGGYVNTNELYEIEKDMETIRIEKRENNTYAFIEVVKGDAKNAKEITLTPTQREEIEKILNKK